MKLLAILAVVLILCYVLRRAKRPRIRESVARQMDDQYRGQSADSPLTYHVPEALESNQIRYQVHRDLQGFRKDMGR